MLANISVTSQRPNIAILPATLREADSTGQTGIWEVNGRSKRFVKGSKV